MEAKTITKIVDLSGRSIRHLFRGKALAYGDIKDGREVVVLIRSMDQHPIISIGPMRSPVHSDQWIYQTAEQAISAFIRWNPHQHPEPENHIRHRSRPNHQRT